MTSDEREPGPGVDPVRLAAAVVAVSRLWLEDSELQSLLTATAHAVRSAVDESAAVSFNLGRPDAPTHLASTAEEASLADGLQVRTGEGPCVDAYDSLRTVVTADVRVDPRWPRLQAACTGLPAASVVAVPVVAGGGAGGGRVGVLNCYSTVPGAFTGAQVQAAEVLALAAGAALDAAQEAERLRLRAAQLDQALESRAVIEQAKGIVMAGRGCTADDAFAHLATLSQQRNVKLRELAVALVEQTSAADPPGARRRP